MEKSQTFHTCGRSLTFQTASLFRRPYSSYVPFTLEVGIRIVSPRCTRPGVKQFVPNVDNRERRIDLPTQGCVLTVGESKSLPYQIKPPPTLFFFL